MRSITAAAAVDPSLLSSAASISAGRELKISVKSSPVVKFAAKRLSVSCSAASSPHFGRRSLLQIAATSFLLPFPKSAYAADETSLLQEEIRKVLTKSKAPSFLRLVFHDAGTFDEGDKTGGMNGSIQYELSRSENAGLEKTVKILEKVKEQIESAKPGTTVSMADLIAIAGAEAVSICGGPEIPVRLGRVDATVPDPEGRLPEESLDAKAMKQSFQKKGFSAQELVALSGAHTIGGKGFGSPVVFDNAYYKILLKKPSSGGMSSMVGLPSDKALAADDECTGWISKYAEDQALFFQDFKKVYTKLVDTGAKWKSA